MDFVNAYSWSPGSIFMVVVTVAFLVNQGWPQLFRKKKTCPLTGNPISGNSQIPHSTVFKEPEVPGGWWSGREVFELERRALFSQSWLYLAHSSQFAKAGAYQSFDIAGFPIFLIRGKDDQIRAFHNVCRHRAYTITRKEAGTSTVLGCRYHGWSYDTYGRLVKAPQFDDVPGFDKSENGLFEIHTHTTHQGWVFVNLNAGQPCAFDESSSQSLAGFTRLAGIGPQSEWVTGRTLSGAFNWKLGVTACHCADLKAKLEQRAAETAPSSLATKMVRVITRRHHQADCSLFPYTILYSFDHADLWLSLTFLPSSETTTQVRYDLFGISPKAVTVGGVLASAVEEVVRSLVEQIESEFQSVTLRPVESSNHTQFIVDRLQEHRKLEKVQGGQILPAMRQPKGSSLFQKAEQYIVGSAILKALAKDPAYTTIYRDWGGAMHRNSIFLQNIISQPEIEMATTLRRRVPSVDHIFFCLPGCDSGDPKINVRADIETLTRFLNAIARAGLETSLKRVILTHNFDRYGARLGCMKQPCEESDPFVTGDVGNTIWPVTSHKFLKDILAAAATKGNWEWITTYAPEIWGFDTSQYLSLPVALGLYGAVSKVLPGSELPFPGNRKSYTALNTWTSADYLAKFCLWAANAPATGNQMFNVINGDVQSFEMLWPKIADYFGCTVPTDMFPAWHKETELCFNWVKSTRGFKDNKAQCVKITNPSQPPLVIHAERLGLLNDPVLHEPAEFRMQIDLQKWADKPEANLAWSKLCGKYSLKEGSWEHVAWEDCTFVLGRTWPCVASMTKARNLGWTGHGDTWDELENIFKDMEKKHLLPPLSELKKDL
ncbi:Aromatic-ring-hydroxylating dioxygenase alpha subunit [Penicillium hispanicum]|uniref:Aromatic-ring-hydroxylating dioxygenase alpha subunit n=1 Tax=Penicillium hispanicum TaxID=1080232 RepID=UPI002541C773|nr:Aromatic-ring-hydroxylating dioxygenase alpha subunit [Penicillium hispanicum]KAJ5570178.1 Aromatic-ring-hydroxylating dioxygenase alpha subunit [Penicillium hispanicum]